MTAVMQEVERDASAATIQPEEIAGRRSPVFVGLSVLLAALIGFGVGWLVFRDTGVDVPSDIDVLLEDYHEAWAAHDGDAVVDLMTAGGIVSLAGQEGASGELLATFVSESPTLSVEDGDILGVFGDTNQVVVKSATVGSIEGFSVFHIVDQFGVPRIAYHVWMGR